jgi:hypothetical protein
MDNCAIYLVASTLTNHLMRKVNLSDTDIELHVGNQNATLMFPNCNFTDCRVQGKISGEVGKVNGTWMSSVLGTQNSNYGDNLTIWTNCVIDLDLTDMTDSSGHQDFFVIAYDNGNLNTNVICRSHYPTGKTAPSIWNYMDHEGAQSIRNGTYLNNQGFTVVEVVGS